MIEITIRCDLEEGEDHQRELDGIQKPDSENDPGQHPGILFPEQFHGPPFPAVGISAQGYTLE